MQQDTFHLILVLGKKEYIAIAKRMQIHQRLILGIAKKGSKYKGRLLLQLKRISKDFSLNMILMILYREKRVLLILAELAFLSFLLVLFFCLSFLFLISLGFF